MAEVVRIDGLRELERAFRVLGVEAPRELRREILQIGKPIEADARARLGRVSQRSAGGIRARVRGGLTLVVEQRKSRVTGRRPDWGAFQMREALIPARAAHADQLVDNVWNALDRLAVRHGF